MINDISIIIQGPLHENSISNIDTYKKYGEIIFVSWAENFYNSIDLIKKIKEKNIFLLLLPYSRFSENSQNIALQVNSIYGGIKISDKNYIIKLRSDEKYSNLDPLIEKMQNSNKIITSNIFFRKYNTYPWHISDHIIAGKKDILLPIFDNCIQYCLNKNKWYINNQDKIVDFPKYGLVPEQIITICSIPVLNKNKTKFYWHIKSQCIDYIKNNFDIINVSELGEFIVSYSQNNKRYYRNNITDFTNSNTDIIYSLSEYE